MYDPDLKAMASAYGGLKRRRSFLREIDWRSEIETIVAVSLGRHGERRNYSTT